MAKISYCLWFDGQAEEAAEFYTGVFEDSRILSRERYPEGSPGEPGSVMTVEFEINGEQFLALNGGPQYSFTPALSIVATCESQEEIDDLWDKLTDGGAEVACGWLTDKFGVSWQIVPSGMAELFGSGDREAAQRAFSAMMGMTKLDIDALRRAYEGSSEARGEAVV